MGGDFVQRSKLISLIVCLLLGLIRHKGEESIHDGREVVSEWPREES